MESWYLLSLISLLMWGIWGIFAKFATENISSKFLFVISGFSAFIVTLIIFATMKLGIEKNSTGIVYALLAGIVGSFGSLFFYYALKNGKASIVVPLTALYPLITVIFGIFILKEKVTAIRMAGIALAIAASILLAI